LITENKEVGLNYMALESIHSLIIDEDLIEIVKQTVKVYIKSVFNLTHNPKYKDLTGTLLYNKFIKNIIKKYFNHIEENIFDVFTYFWNDIKMELEKVVKGELVNPTQTALREKNFKLIEGMKNLKNLITICKENSSMIEVKSQIYMELLYLLNFLDKFIGYDNEEDILEIITLIINDIKLIPDVYSDKLNLLIEKLSTHYHNKYEIYHINFIFNFLKNVRQEIALLYKEKV
jgi:hypothetical protein